MVWMTEDSSLASLRPWTFSANTRNSYCCPSVNLLALMVSVSLSVSPTYNVKVTCQGRI